MDNQLLLADGSHTECAPNVDRLHELLIERADKDHAKRIRDRQKRFGKLHDIDRDLAERAEVATENRNALIALMSQYGLLIPARALPTWRPTHPTSGDIEGLQESVTIIATDGLLGWFLTFTGEPWCGHIKHFSGKVKPLFRVAPKISDKPKKVKKTSKQPKERTRRQQILDSL